jgi:phage-related protein
LSSYNLGTASGRIEIDGKAGVAGFKAVETAADAMFGVMQRKVESVQQLGRRLRLTGAAGVAGFGVAIKAASNFETQMSGVQAVTNAQGQEFEDLRQKALKLGADTVYSASEAALAIEELAKAGIPVKDILNGAAEGAVALAAAGGISLPEAATIAANAMNQFGIDASKVADVADILAGVANTSAADVSSIGTSLSQAGAVANLAGLSFRDTAIAIGEMADAGINGSDAGTSLKTMLNNLIPTTQKQINKFIELDLLTQNLSKANETLAKVTGGPAQSSMAGVRRELGKYVESIGKGTVGTVKNKTAVQDLLMQYGGLENQFFKANGEIKNLEGLQGQLAKSLKGMTKEQKLSTLETLFGADAMRATAILSLAGAKGYREFSKAVKETTAADVAKTRLNNLSGAVEAMKGSFETTMITIGNIFLPVVTKIVQGITFMINAFNSLPGPVKTAIGIVLGIVSILLVAIGTIMASITAIALFVAQWYALRVIGIATGFLKGFIAAQRAGLGIMAAWNAGLATSAARTTRLAKITSIAGKAMLLFGRMARAAWVMMLGPVGIVIAIVAGLVALGVLLYKKWTPFRNLVDQIAAVIRDKLTAAWERMKPVIASVVAAFVRFGNFVKSSVLPVLKQVGGQLLAKLISGFQKLQGMFTSTIIPALTRLRSAFSGAGAAGGSLWDKIQPAVSGFLKFAGVVGGALFNALKKMGSIFVSVILPVLIKVAGFLGGVLIDSLVGFLGGVMNVVSGIITFFTGLINFITGIFTGNWSKAWLGIKQMFAGILQAIWGVIQMWFYGSVLKVFAIGFGLIRGIVGAGLGAVRTIFATILRAILGVVRGTFRLYMGIIRGTMNLIRTIIMKAWSVIRGGVSAALRAIWNVVKTVFNGITGAVRGGTSTVKNVITGAWNAVKSTTSRLWNSLKTVVKGAIDGVVNLAKGIKDRVLGAMGDTLSWFKQKGIDIVQGLINGILSMVDKVKGAISKVTDTIGKFIPGSPVREGALKVLNRGHSGKEIVNFLIQGVEKQAPDLQKTVMLMAGMMARTLSQVQPAAATYRASTLTTAGTAARPSPSAVKPEGVTPLKKSKTPAGASRSRLISGTLGIDASGRAWITGIAEDVVDNFNDDNDRRNRM